MITLGHISSWCTWINRLLVDGGAKDFNLAFNHLEAGPSNRRSMLDARFKIEHLHHIVSKLAIQLFEVLQGQFTDLASSRLGKRNCTARDVVGFTEWCLPDYQYLLRFTTHKPTHPLPDEVFCEISCEGVGRQRLTHFITIDLCDRLSQLVTRNAMNLLTFIVAITPSAILREAEMLSTVSKRGSLSSWRSLLYVEGRPFSVTMNPAICKAISFGLKSLP